MTNTTKYELTFWGSANVQKFPRYRRMHANAPSLYAAIAKVGQQVNLTAYRPVIYCGSKQVPLSAIK